MPRKVICIVEDDDDIRDGLADLLTSKGFDVRPCPHGAHALQQLRDGSIEPDLIILDLLMPVMDGVSFLQHRAIEPRLANTPVIVLTAQPEVVIGLVDDVAAVLPKPLPVQRLLEIINAVFEASGPIPVRTLGTAEVHDASTAPPQGERRVGLPIRMIGSRDE